MNSQFTVQPVSHSVVTVACCIFTRLHLHRSLLHSGYRCVVHPLVMTVSEIWTLDLPAFSRTAVWLMELNQSG